MMLTTLVLINTLLADPEWNLYRSVFPDDAGDVIMAMADGDRFTECIGNAIHVCEHLGGHRVCSFCFIAQPDGTMVCSFICGDPTVPNGCDPPPPCPPWPPQADANTEPPLSVEPVG